MYDFAQVNSVAKARHPSKPMTLGKMRLYGITHRRLAELTTKRAKKRPAEWSARLTRSLTIKDGTKLVTLADAREILIKYFETMAQGASVAHAMERVLIAAETGTFADRKAATDQVAIVLKLRAAG